MGRRRANTAPLLVIFAVFAVALPHLGESSGRHHHQHSHVQSRGHGVEGVLPARVARKQWPCCDNCGGCTKSIPPQCQCMDAAPGGCHPACQNCAKSGLSVNPPVYHCLDRIPNFCQQRCNAAAAH